VHLKSHVSQIKNSLERNRTFVTKKTAMNDL